MLNFVFAKLFIFKEIIFFSMISLLLNGCTSPGLSVQTQYLSQEYLASYHVGTPDCLAESMTGQRLLIGWALSPQEIQEKPSLHLKVRLRNRQEQEVKIPITKRQGNYMYDVLNQTYEDSGGILTYFVEIRTTDRVITSWKHPLWVELITFDFPKEAQEKSSNENFFN